ncbi:MAG: hypothetical protein QNJ47_13625 [Nostocaceae cyanobacterium]|nr:hypothetical protein [Nostocaceae cyanobacterium]
MLKYFYGLTNKNIHVIKSVRSLALTCQFAEILLVEYLTIGSKYGYAILHNRG